jgi:hypothetical protein
MVPMQDISIAGGNSHIAVLVNPQRDILAVPYSQSTPRIALHAHVAQEHECLHANMNGQRSYLFHEKAVEG